jgi:hypothetical protein
MSEAVSSYTQHKVDSTFVYAVSVSLSNTVMLFCTTSMGDPVIHFLTAWTFTLYNISIFEYESVFNEIPTTITIFGNHMRTTNVAGS